MLTKKDFIAIAEILKSDRKSRYDGLAVEVCGGLSHKFADYFETQNELFNRVLFLRACGDMNQCDGCCRSLPVVDGNHVNKHGRAVMCCTKDRYEEVTDV